MNEPFGNSSRSARSSSHRVSVREQRPGRPDSRGLVRLGSPEKTTVQNRAMASIVATARTRPCSSAWTSARRPGGGSSAVGTLRASPTVEPSIPTRGSNKSFACSSPPENDGAMIDHDVLADLEARGLMQECIDRDGLAARLAEGPITLYFGCDPTADSLHVGNLLAVGPSPLPRGWTSTDRTGLWGHRHDR